MELSLAGLIGAIIGTIASAAVYGPLVGVIERSFEKGAAGELALLRRAVLALDMLVCAGIGYWIGQHFGG